MIELGPDFQNPNRAVADMVRSELRYRRLFEAARDGVLIVDPDTRKIIDANPFMTVLLGYSRQELVGRELFELGSLADGPASRAAFEELQEHGFIRYENLPLETNSGQTREVEFVSNIYREGARNVIQCNIRDITARKQLARQLQEKARLLDLSNDAIIVRDLNGNIRLWNEGAAQLYGWRSAEVLGRNLHALLQTEFPRPLPEIDAQLRSEGEFTGEVIQTSRDGRRRPALCRWVLDVATGSVLASYTDITDRKAAELKMIQARDEAIAASRAKDEFLATLSHELRTPLSPVLLMASDAADDPAMPAPAREIFAMIGRNVALEARLIDDLLDVSRITHSKMVLDQQLVDVHLALRDAIVTVQAEVDRKQLGLTLDLLPGKPCVMGDPIRLQQIFWNVLRNAAKFTPMGGRIAVSTRLLPGDTLQIKIVDTGIGMTASELGRIFVSFSQGDHGAKGGSRLFGGLGLGLSISRMLVTLHAGTIRAESRGLNEGSTFVIELPVTPAAAAEELMPADDAGMTHLVAVPLGARPGRILLVEDHEGTRTALTRLLTRRRYDVVPVGTVAEARAAAMGAAFDVLISDIGLPDGSGYDLMAELHTRQGLPGIAITGFGEAEDIVRSQLAGFSAHITKPASIQALERALATVAAASKRPGAVAVTQP